MRLNASSTGRIQTSELLPLKWFSTPQCWRFETTQRGRKREHFQWNCDIIGVESSTAELELFAVMVDFFKSVGLTAQDVGIRVNSRKILGASLAKAGVSDDDFAKVCVVVDKMDKIGSAEVLRQLTASPSGTSSGGLGLALEVAQKVVQAVGPDFTLEKNGELDGVEELKQFFELAKSYGIADWLVFDPCVVRGLSYYTGIVAECFDRKGQLRAVAGFGRYDRLFTTFGAPVPVAAVGFGMGDCVLLELLKERNLLPSFTNYVDVLVAAYPGCYGQALAVAEKLRSQANVNVDMYLLEGKKIANVFKFADRVGAKYMAFVAPGELEKNAVRIKDLRSGSEGKRIEKDVPLDELAFFKEILQS
jgi:histidyl-tRNA synthetase